MPRHTDPVADLFQKILAICLAFLIAGCASVPVTPVAPGKKISSDRSVERRTVAYKPSLDSTLEERIRAGPEHADQDVRTVLARAHAPGSSLYGSICRRSGAGSFANFLDRMGYRT